MQALPPLPMSPAHPEQLSWPHAVLSHCVDPGAVQRMEEQRQAGSFFWARPAEPTQSHELQLSFLLSSADATAARTPLPATGSSTPRTTVMLRNLPGGGRKASAVRIGGTVPQAV